MMADIHMLVFGDGGPAGTGVADGSKRWPRLLAAALSLIPHVYAVEGAGYTLGDDGVLSQLTVAASDTAVSADSVGLVLLAAGYGDAKAKADVSAAASQLFSIATAIRKRYGNARLAIMVGPEGLKPDGFEDSYEPFYRGLSAAARTVGADTVVDAWDWLFDKPDDVQPDGVHPNETGHALIAAQAQPLMPTVDVPAPPDLTPVEPLGIRKYAPGRADPVRDERRGMQKRDREKNQANNSTGSETEQTTIKLNALTKQLQDQQQLTTSMTATLTSQQERIARLVDDLRTVSDKQAEMITQLQTQQTEMVRRTPEPHGSTQSTPSAQAGTTPTTVHSYSIGIPTGKTQAFVSLSATASTTDPAATPFLEIYEDSTLVSLMTVPDIMPANGLSFSQTVTGNHSYTVRVATGTGSATVRNITSWFTVIYYV